MTPLEDHPRCVTYLAKITDEKGTAHTPLDKVVVKFVGRYGKDVHKFLADKGWGPQLRYFGNLRETTVSDEIRGAMERTMSDLHLESNAIYMVVMDYIKARGDRPKDAGAQIEEVLKQLHAKGYVYGDLREPNILFDADGKVKFIDFDWSGQYDMRSGDEKPSDGEQKETEETNSYEGREGRYACYPLAMSRIETMWAAGMEPLQAIRPEHDREMLRKLDWW